VGHALIRNWHTDVVSVENPSVGASKADLVVPVPSSTSRVSGLGVVEVRENALSFLEVVALVARGTVSVGSVGHALIRNWHTDVVSVENPSVGASKADLVVPVPSSTSRVSGLCVVEVRENALSFLEVVALVARGTVSVGSVGHALIRNGDTNVVSVENPSVGASKADLVVPVPSSTSRVSGSGIIGK